ncbi:MAG: hypothetical protein AAF108_07640 [Planctomycetota bacterium]
MTWRAGSIQDDAGAWHRPKQWTPRRKQNGRLDDLEIDVVAFSPRAFVWCVVGLAAGIGLFALFRTLVPINGWLVVVFPVGVTWAVLTSAKLVFAGDIRRDSMTFILRRGHCASCFYPLDADPDSDGLCRCPECGARWRVGGVEPRDG